MFAWARWITTSIDSAFTTALLWRLAWRMVVQMSTGRAMVGRVVAVGDGLGWGLVRCRVC